MTSDTTNNNDANTTENTDTARLPNEEWDRVLVGLAVYTNTMDNPDTARSIRSTARRVARQLTGSPKGE